MKKMILIFTLFASSTLFAGPVVEIFECELNEGKTYDDLSSMMDTFSGYLEKAGLEDTYTAHVGFQQIPIKAGSVNWIGISPSAEDLVKLSIGLPLLKMEELLELCMNQSTVVKTLL